MATPRISRVGHAKTEVVVVLLDGHGDDGGAGATGHGFGGGGEQERGTAVGRAVGGQLLQKQESSEPP